MLLSLVLPARIHVTSQDLHRLPCASGSFAHRIGNNYDLALMHAFELQPIDFRYILDGAGWATATLVVGNQTVEMSASDLCDSPKDLLTALIRLRNGSPRAKVLFLNEPGEHLLELVPAARAAVTLELWWFSDWTSDEFESDKKHVLTATVAFYELEQAVLRTFRELLDTWGLKRYKYEWSHPFPSKEFETLIGDVR